KTAGSAEYASLVESFPDIEFLPEAGGLVNLASIECDILLSAIVGGAGCAPAMAATKHAARIALANKETLVMAGDLFMNAVRENKCELIPVDSEHSALFALLDGKNRDELRRLIITASGGSLRDKTADELSRVTPEQALAHPTWNMGAKITIDSATLMNKGFEVIEAHHLFSLPYDMIDVIVHPESVIHSMIETCEGSIFAHMSVTDMAFPIANALTYPDKCENPFGRLDLASLAKLTFREYDPVRFPALRICYEAGRTGGTATAVLNAANEIAVSAFLDRRIAYGDIVRVVSDALESHEIMSAPALEDIFEADKWARAHATKMIRG
ncbi:MAG TPA: 1-deoxy-D-xylulose-5-phosphate reductoisomerase, partial [Spirochaetota bacterium]|nr:1-deoxy-D-xylulose-5-phosphate reductoisomerase [Spirochaetota bacterium]